MKPGCYEFTVVPERRFGKGFHGLDGLGWTWLAVFDEVCGHTGSKGAEIVLGGHGVAKELGHGFALYGELDFSTYGLVGHAF